VEDQRDRASGNSRSSRPAVRVGPFPPHQVSMPAQQGLRLHEEASPASSRQKPAQSSEHCSIRWLQGWTVHVAAQDGDLVTEHDDLDGQVLLLTTGETDQLEHADEAKVEKGECHAPSSSPRSPQRKSRSRVRMTFTAPTACRPRTATDRHLGGSPEGHFRPKRMLQLPIRSIMRTRPSFLQPAQPAMLPRGMQLSGLFPTIAL